MRLVYLLRLKQHSAVGDQKRRSVGRESHGFVHLNQRGLAVSMFP